jgi:hypothetical protein
VAEAPVVLSDQQPLVFYRYMSVVDLVAVLVAVEADLAGDLGGGGFGGGGFGGVDLVVVVWRVPGAGGS